MKKSQPKTMLLIPPALHCNQNRFMRYEAPLGLAYIAAMLEKHNYDVRIVDCLTLGLGAKQTAEQIQVYQPDLVGIYCLTANRFDAFSTAKIAKKVSPNSIVVAGGPHVSGAAEDTLKHIPAIDVVVRGEGEGTILDLLKTVEGRLELGQVSGVSFRNSERKTVHNPDRPLIDDLDQLPFPARHLLPLHMYSRYYIPYLPDGVQGRIFSLIASRGCPWNCFFCATPNMWGRRIRYRTVNNVVQEIEYCMDKFRYKAFRFHDDTITANRKWILKFCEELNKRKIDVPWSLCGRVNLVDKEILHRMKKAGCYSIAFGIESGHDVILKNIGKQTTLEEIVKAVELSKEEGILPFGYLMVGNLGESEETLKKTLSFAYSMDFVTSGMSCAVIYPNTAFYVLGQSTGRIPKGFSWTRKIEQTPPELSTMPVFMNPFEVTLLPPQEIAHVAEKHSDQIRKLVERAVTVHLVHNYGRHYLLRPRFWYNSLRYLPMKQFLYRLLCTLKIGKKGR